MSISRIRAGLLLSAFACVLGGCASLRSTPARTAESQDLAEVRGVCASVMGLPSRSDQYTDCVASLSYSKDRATRERSLGDAHSECAAKQMSAGSPEFFECVVESERTIAPSARREQLACASAGVDPERAGFSDCVAGLHQAMVAVHIPWTD